MNRKIALTVLALVLAFSPAFAEDQAPVDTTDIAVQESSQAPGGTDAP